MKRAKHSLTTSPGRVGSAFGTQWEHPIHCAGAKGDCGWTFHQFSTLWLESCDSLGRVVCSHAGEQVELVGRGLFSELWKERISWAPEELIQSYSWYG